MLTEITLPNDNTLVTLEDCPKYGIFDIYIQPKECTDSDRSYSRFNIVRSNNPIRHGSVRTVSSRGKTESQIDMQWCADSKPQLFYRPAPKDSPEPITYIVSIVGQDEHSKLELLASMQNIKEEHITNFLKRESRWKV